MNYGKVASGMNNFEVTPNVEASRGSCKISDGETDLLRDFLGLPPQTEDEAKSVKRSIGTQQNTLVESKRQRMDILSLVSCCKLQQFIIRLFVILQFSSKLCLELQLENIK